MCRQGVPEASLGQELWNLACRGGNRWNRGGAQSHRLWDGRGSQSRKVGRSGMLPSSGSGMSRGVGWSQLMGRESGEEGCMAALGHGDGGDGGAFLSRQRGDLCLLLLEA